MIDFRLLGVVALTDARGTPLESLLAQPRRLALLAYLAAATPRGARRRDTLLPLFWPELDQPRARAALRQALHVLRNVLGPDVVKTRGDEEIELDADRLRCDLVQFERALADGDPEEALDLYRGHLLEGFFIPDAPEFEQWLEAERARRREAAVGAARVLVARAEKGEDWGSASRWARRAVRLAPLDEDLLRRLIVLLDRAGDRAGALAAYEEFARRMAAEFDAKPAAETQALIAAVRTREAPRGAPTLAPTPSPTRDRPGLPLPARRDGRRRWAMAATAAIVVVATLGVMRWKRVAAAAVRCAHADPMAAPPAGSGTANAAAYDFYLRGRHTVRDEKRDNDSVAITLFQCAVALDPSYAAAYAQLAHAYGLWVMQIAPRDSDAFVRAFLARDKALALNPDLPEGHYARAYLLWGPDRQFPHELAIAEDRRALVVDPKFAPAHHHLGVIFMHLGLLDSAIAEFRQTLVLDPDLPMAQQRIGIALVYQGHYLDGLRTYQQVPSKSNPTYWNYQLIGALLYLDRDPEARASIEHYLKGAPSDPGGSVTAERAVLEAKEGDSVRAEADIRAAVRIGAGYQHFHHTAYSIAMAYALMHRPGPAVQYLREAASTGLPCYPCFAHDPFLARIRGDSGFQAFMKELKGQWLHYDSLLARPIATP